MWGEKVVVTDGSPKDILALLEAKGFKTVFLAGGGQLNSSFMKDGLVDEVYFDVEPLLFGKGIKVFADADFECTLELLDTKQLNAHTVQLHYRVHK